MLIYDFDTWQKKILSQFPESVTCTECGGLGSARCNTCAGRARIPMKDIVHSWLYMQMVEFDKKKLDLWMNRQPKSIPKGYGTRYEGFISPLKSLLEAWGLELIE